jgi:hypothetical protein
MCFVLFAGTSQPIALRKSKKEPPGLGVEKLSDDELPVTAHFSKPYVQYIGSTSGCGCDFPFSMFEYGETEFAEELDGEEKNADFNRRALVDLLSECHETELELYGMWNGDYTESPASREVIRLDEILDRKFHFRERGFYKVKIS